ncbi:MAG: hypothetical protein LAP87_06565 [Acidobacteriia bacterium]|nr:hypothetical protein [Terriglobia bacterium]
MVYRGTHQGAPLGGEALYGSGSGWHRDTGDFAVPVQALLEAGAVPPGPEELEPSEAVRDVLRAATDPGSR